MKDSEEVRRLKGQLAERDALLREVLVGLWPSTPIAIKINATLSASAEPSASVDRDERAEFEAEFKKKGRPLTRAEYDPEAYGNAFDDGAWLGWQARAVLERKP